MHAKVFYEFTVIPDTVFADSNYLQIGDTVAIYAEGADSVIILYEDSIAGADSIYYDLAFPTQHIYLSLSSEHHAVNEGVYGINITDLFEPGHGNINDNDNYLVGGQPDPWASLIESAPKTLRMSSFVNGISVANTTCPSVMDAVPGSVCVTIPGIAFGYIEIPFTATPRLGKQETAMAVFPNPAGTELTIHIYSDGMWVNDIYTYSIIDAKGSVTAKGQIASGEKIAVHTLPNGIYTLLLTYEGKIIASERVVVNR